MLQSFLRVSGVLQSLRQRKFIRGRFRRQTNGFVQQLDRRIERFFLHSNHAQQMQQIGMFGVYFQKTAVNGFRFVQLSLFVQAHGVLKNKVK